MLVQSSSLSSWELGTRRFARPQPHIPAAVLHTMRTAVGVRRKLEWVVGGRSEGGGSQGRCVLMLVILCVMLGL